ncbi:ceramide glucosyltransferase-B-like [Anastrepha obliqua]|uniref:ceramide glucosyltransferase-B-like n=1 Tax=Anastrepha obliqua TaxID=95512 RepID=UPI002409C9FB|nr:ceramide glucosyltransferase-B-like [Anastrepha obliqua]
MRISNQPALQNSGICDVNRFQERFIRWAKLRVAMVPTTILLEPLFECMVLGALASWSASLLFNWDPLVFYLVVSFRFDITFYCAGKRTLQLNYKWLIDIS